MGRARCDKRRKTAIRAGFAVRRTKSKRGARRLRCSRTSLPNLEESETRDDGRHGPARGILPLLFRERLKKGCGKGGVDSCSKAVTSERNWSTAADSS